MKLLKNGKNVVTALLCSAGLLSVGAHAQTLTSNSTGNHDGYYYTFWKDSGIRARVPLISP
jgi:hypothetical protein